MAHAIDEFTSRNHWASTKGIKARTFRCGFCSNDVASNLGWELDGAPQAAIRICPQCNAPTFFDVLDRQWPGAKPGQPVSHLPERVAEIYAEARSALAGNAYTGSVMLCRKLLMHTAVEKGAPGNLSFKAYVQWLVDERYAPRGAESWLAYVKDRGNDANHEIALMKREDAEGVLAFTEALLRSVYELPNLVPTPQSPPAAP